MFVVCKWYPVHLLYTGQCLIAGEIKTIGGGIRVPWTLFMPPTLKKWGGILVSACPYVCMYVCIHVRDIVLKLHVWIPHGKIADAYFWFSLNYLPLSNYGPLTNKGMKFCKCRISKSIIARNLKLVSADRG